MSDDWVLKIEKRTMTEQQFAKYDEMVRKTFDGDEKVWHKDMVWLRDYAVSRNLTAKQIIESYPHEDIKQDGLLYYPILWCLSKYPEGDFETDRYITQQQQRKLSNIKKHFMNA